MAAVQLTFGSAVRIGALVLTTLIVWVAASLQLLFVPFIVAVRGEACGTGGVVFLMVVGAAWTVSLVALLVDGAQLYRAHLSRPSAWLRTFPAAVAVIATPVVLSLG